MGDYLILVYLLFALAILDLVVGVSNDAVNFLNSAIGSKVAKVRTILIIASIGILAGTLFSDGVMEVARKDIFIPSFFTFDKIIVVFLAVMLTDILLLDFYNSVGLPTSTTVSIVFEILGAAFMIGWLIASADGGDVVFSEFINFNEATKIIGGIFLSVLIAFSFGMLVQYIARLVFTFNLDKSLKRGGAIFSGISISIITYFLLFKGAKHASFMTEDTVAWIKQYIVWLMAGSFIFWGLVTQLLMSWKNINPLRIVVLAGTLSLAMAFASNDLVNFIGVAVAGLQSYWAWADSGMLASEYTMGALGGEVDTPMILLVGAGTIMVLTLWFSGKSRKVTETEVNLGRQGEGEERFRPNLFSRAIVGGAMMIGKVTNKAIPNGTLESIDKRFEPVKVKKEVAEKDRPAFDLLRASINLVGASIIIAYASNSGKPLSTTYVSFMVAMGTSLADRAWGRESAVYRVAGVINVIAGWLMTALIAFVAAALVALILNFTGSWGAFGIAGIAGVVLIMSQRRFRAKEREKKMVDELVSRQLANIDDAIASSKKETVERLEGLKDIVTLSIRSLVGQNGDVLSRNLKILEKQHSTTFKAKGKLVKFVRKMGRGHTEAGKLYLTVYDLMEELESNAIAVARYSKDHVNNHHMPPSREFLDDMLEIDQRISRFFDTVSKSIDKLDFTNSERIAEDKRDLLDFISERLDAQIQLIQDDEVSSRLGTLQTSLLLEMKDMVAITARMLKLYTRYAYRPVEEK